MTLRPPPTIQVDLDNDPLVIKIIRELGLVVVACLALATLLILLLNDKTLDASVLLVFSNAASVAIGALAMRQRPG